MAAAIRLLLAFLVLLCILHAGGAETCTTSNISINQTETGGWAHGNSVYEVEVSNGCLCSQSSVLLKCSGFDTTLSVDPAVFRPVGDGFNCVVNDYAPLHHGDPAKFQYAWQTMFDFAVVGSNITCP